MPKSPSIVYNENKSKHSCVVVLVLYLFYTDLDLRVSNQVDWIIWWDLTCTLPSSAMSSMQRDSLFVYQQDVDLTSELTTSTGLSMKGKRPATRQRCMWRLAAFDQWKGSMPNGFPSMGIMFDWHGFPDFNKTLVFVGSLVVSLLLLFTMMRIMPETWASPRFIFGFESSYIIWLELRYFPEKQNLVVLLTRQLGPRLLPSQFPNG